MPNEEKAADRLAKAKKYLGATMTNENLVFMYGHGDIEKALKIAAGVEDKKTCSHCGTTERVCHGLRKDLCYRCYDELLNDDRGPDPYQERANRRMEEREEDL